MSNSGSITTEVKKTLKKKWKRKVYEEVSKGKEKEDSLQEDFIFSWFNWKDQVFFYKFISSNY